MRYTRLILIDGLPGSGKSTTAERLAQTLRARGIRTDLLKEREQDHPLNVGGDLHPSGDVTGAALFGRYTPESLAHESLERWRAFVCEAQTQDAVTVAESYPFQNSVRVLLQMDARREVIQEYTEEVEEVIAPLNPVLLYFDHSDAARALRRISEQRGPEWTSYLVAVATQCAYAQVRKLEGWEGALALVRDYKALLDALMAQFPFPVLVLRDCRDRWAACHGEIHAFLGIIGDNPTA